MAQRDLLNRSIEAGRDVSQRTQEALDALVREVAKAAEAQTSQAQQLVQELVERLQREFGGATETRTLVQEDMDFELPKSARSLVVLR